MNSVIKYTKKCGIIECFMQGRKSRGGCIPLIIFEGGCNPPPIIPPNNLSYAAIFDDLSCGINGLPFFANMVTDCYSLFLFKHSINKGQTSIVRIAEKKIKLCFLYATEQRCSKKKRDEHC